MLNIWVNFDFCFMKKLWDWAHEKLVNIQGGHHVGTNIHGWQPYMKIAIYVLKSANGGLLCRPLYIDFTSWICTSQFFLSVPSNIKRNFCGLFRKSELHSHLKVKSMKFGSPILTQGFPIMAPLLFKMTFLVFLKLRNMP